MLKLNLNNRMKRMQLTVHPHLSLGHTHKSEDFCILHIVIGYFFCLLFEPLSNGFKDNFLPLLILCEKRGEGQLLQDTLCVEM